MRPARRSACAHRATPSSRRRRLRRTSSGAPGSTAVAGLVATRPEMVTRPAAISSAASSRDLARPAADQFGIEPGSYAPGCPPAGGPPVSAVRASASASAVWIRSNTATWSCALRRSRLSGRPRHRQQTVGLGAAGSERSWTGCRPDRVGACRLARRPACCPVGSCRPPAVLSVCVVTLYNAGARPESPHSGDADDRTTTQVQR